MRTPILIQIKTAKCPKIVNARNLLTTLAQDRQSYIFEKIMAGLKTEDYVSLSQTCQALRSRTSEILERRKKYEWSFISPTPDEEFERIKKRHDMFDSPSTINKISRTSLCGWVNGESGNSK